MFEVKGWILCDCQHCDNTYPVYPHVNVILKMFFHFEERNVNWLADRFLGTKEENRGGALLSLHRMKICLRYLRLAKKLVLAKQRYRGL